MYLIKTKALAILTSDRIRVSTRENKLEWHAHSHSLVSAVDITDFIVYSFEEHSIGFLLLSIGPVHLHCKGC